MRIKSHSHGELITLRAPRKTSHQGILHKMCQEILYTSVLMCQEIFYSNVSADW